jgi:hypothetical protein
LEMPGAGWNVTAIHLDDCLGVVNVMTEKEILTFSWA